MLCVCVLCDTCLRIGTLSAAALEHHNSIALNVYFTYYVTPPTTIGSTQNSYSCLYDYYNSRSYILHNCKFVNKL